MERLQGGLSGLANAWMLANLSKGKFLFQVKNRRASIDSSTELVGEGTELIPRSPRCKYGAWGSTRTQAISEEDEENKFGLQRNDTNEEMSALSTIRYKFMKKTERSSSKERQKWLVYDDVTKRKITLHQIAGVPEELTSGSSELPQGELARIPGSHGTVGMNMALFREVVLLRCSRKCPYILNCQGFALDASSNLYISTEYFDGETLKQFLSKRPEHTVPAMKETSRQLLKALNFLDCHKIVHNDVTSSNVLIRHNDITSARGEAEYQIKLMNFQHARDSGTTIQRTDEYFCKNCHSVERRSVPSDDMTSFGYLLFTSLQGFKPWMTSCSCDVNYVKFCMKLPQSKKTGSETQKKLNGSNPERMDDGSQLYTPRKHPSRIHRWSCKKANNESRDNRRSRRWQNLDKKLACCLAMLFSPDPLCRPTASELLSGAKFRGLFGEDNKSASWTKSGITSLFSVTCVSPQSVVNY